MERELREAIRAGAIGFTTTRSPIHETPDGRPVASRLATWDEVRRLVGAMGELNAGIFELAGEAVGRERPDSAAFRDYHVRLRDLAVETGRPVTFGNFSRLEARDVWPRYMALLDETAAAGGGSAKICGGSTPVQSECMPPTGSHTLMGASVSPWYPPRHVRRRCRSGRPTAR